MERTRVFPPVSLIGVVLMAIGFAAYVIEPADVYGYVFAVGLAVYAVVHVLTYFTGRRLESDLESIRMDEEINGYVYYMDGQPEIRQETITYLTRRRPCPR